MQPATLYRKMYMHACGYTYAELLGEEREEGREVNINNQPLSADWMCRQHTEKKTTYDTMCNNQRPFAIGRVEGKSLGGGLQSPRKVGATDLGEALNASK